MWKRILIVTALVGLVGVVLGAGILPTMDGTGQVVEAQGQGHGGGQRGVDEASDTGSGLPGGGRAEGRGTRPGGSSDSDSHLSGRTEGRGKGQGAQSGTDQAHAAQEWVTLAGVVTTVDEDTLLVQTDDGAQVVVEGRAWRFAQEEGFWAASGDEVMLTGFHEGEEFKVGRIEDTTSGPDVLLREDSGRPMWAGRGRMRS